MPVGPHRSNIKRGSPVGMGQHIKTAGLATQVLERNSGGIGHGLVCSLDHHGGCCGHPAPVSAEQASRFGACVSSHHNGWPARHARQQNFTRRRHVGRKIERSGAPVRVRRHSIRRCSPQLRAQCIKGSAHRSRHGLVSNDDVPPERPGGTQRHQGAHLGSVFQFVAAALRKTGKRRQAAQSRRHRNTRQVNGIANAWQRRNFAAFTDTFQRQTDTPGRVVSFVCEVFAGDQNDRNGRQRTPGSGQITHGTAVIAVGKS